MDKPSIFPKMFGTVIKVLEYNLFLNLKKFSEPLHLYYKLPELGFRTPSTPGGDSITSKFPLTGRCAAKPTTNIKGATTLISLRNTVGGIMCFVRTACVIDRPGINKRFDVKFETRFRSLNKRQRKIKWCETRSEMFIDTHWGTRVNIRRGARNIVSPPLLPPPGNWNTGDSRLSEIHIQL